MSNYEPTFTCCSLGTAWAIARGSSIIGENQLQNTSTLCATKVDRQKLYNELINHISFTGATGKCRRTIWWYIMESNRHNFTLLRNGRILNESIRKRG